MVINVLLLLGVAVVLPLAGGGRWLPWVSAAAGAAASPALPRGGGAAVLVLPWLAVAAHGTWARLRPVLRRRRGGVADIGRAVAAGYAVVAGVAFTASRLGERLFGVG